MNHIRDKLPDMKARLNTLMGQAQQELNSFGDAAVYGDKNQVHNRESFTYDGGADTLLARRVNTSVNDPVCARLHIVH